MLRVVHSRAGQGAPPAGDAEDRWRRPHPYGRAARLLLALAALLYFVAGRHLPRERLDAWLDERLFWEPIGVVAIALLLTLVIDARRENRRLAAAPTPSSPRAVSELVPICVHCKAVQNGPDQWQPIEEYLDRRTADKFSRSLCPACLDRLAG